MQTKVARPVKTYSSENEWTKEHWCNFATAVLGVWLVLTAVSSNLQSQALFLSDIACGATLLILGLVSNKFPLARWLTAITGTWLLFAPLVFWAPTSVSYTNDTLTGTLAILLSFVFAGAPGQKPEDSDAEIPRGWSYNPSAWSQRIPLIALALVGFALARYMAAYQLGHTDSSWDPFFGESTERVLKSEVSKAFPVSDAGLGALSYIIDALAGVVGGVRRWRTMPWMVLLFGLLVVPPGVVSIVLVIMQPLGVGAWCSLCLLASLAMLVMVPMTVDEVIATVQYLRQAKRAGLPFWKTLIGGGPELPLKSAPASLTVVQDAPALSGNTRFQPLSLPFGIVVAALLGAWMMLSPVFFTANALALVGIYVISALVITCSFIAFAEVCRSVRWFNVLLGAALVLSPFVIVGYSQSAVINSVICGVFIAVLSVRKGRIREAYAGWNQYIV